MTVRYDKLWTVMKTNKMKKSELAKAAGLSQYTMTKLNQDRIVSMDVMIKLCKIFHCDIGDIMENYEQQRELLHLPDYVMPVGMLIFGYPTQQQQNRPKPERVGMEYIVHENGYSPLSSTQLEEMWTPRAGEKGYEAWMQAFCNRKYNSDFSREMTRSVAKYLEQYKYGI